MDVWWGDGQTLKPEIDKSLNSEALLLVDFFACCLGDKDKSWKLSFVSKSQKATEHTKNGPKKRGGMDNTQKTFWANSCLHLSNWTFFSSSSRILCLQTLEAFPFTFSNGQPLLLPINLPREVYKKCFYLKMRTREFFKRKYIESLIFSEHLFCIWQGREPTWLFWTNMSSQQSKVDHNHVGEAKQLKSLHKDQAFFFTGHLHGSHEKEREGGRCFLKCLETMTFSMLKQFGHC